MNLFKVSSLTNRMNVDKKTAVGRDSISFYLLLKPSGAAVFDIAAGPSR